MEWQTIKTAPKDEVIDLFNKDGFRLIEQWWSEEESMWVPSQLTTEYFTHWMRIEFPKIED
jgi:hypothetical protein